MVKVFAKSAPQQVQYWPRGSQPVYDRACLQEAQGVDARPSVQETTVAKAEEPVVSDRLTEARQILAESKHMVAHPDLSSQAAELKELPTQKPSPPSPTQPEESPPPPPWCTIINDNKTQSRVRHLECTWAWKDRARWFHTVDASVNWEQPRGMPRKTAWMVGEGCNCAYQYSTHTVPAQVFPQWMKELMAEVMPLCGLTDPH